LTGKTGDRGQENQADSLRNHKNILLKEKSLEQNSTVVIPPRLKTGIENRPERHWGTVCWAYFKIVSSFTSSLLRCWNRSHQVWRHLLRFPQVEEESVEQRWWAVFASPSVLNCYYGGYYQYIWRFSKIEGIPARIEEISSLFSHEFLRSLFSEEVNLLANLLNREDIPGVDVYRDWRLALLQWSLELTFIVIDD